ncbi:hypothetical protein Cylst_2615 [Cylindrospermum stagnale PCC 7417]|uniref:Uncharacterized protein n=1 Tax=Cylindrospermum stagnale PCC 7417 TaxID=56107 RepID=K9WYE4_9NOST|nr:hypothetical protein Cylst_2615 [Cylindrospermum stagnale PCC 7417]
MVYKFMINLVSHSLLNGINPSCRLSLPVDFVIFGNETVLADKNDNLIKAQ